MNSELSFLIFAVPVIDVLVDCVELLSRGILLQQLTGDLPLRSEDNSILGQDTKSGTGVGDGL